MNKLNSSYGYESLIVSDRKRPIKFRLWDDWNRRYHIVTSYSLLNKESRPQFTFVGEDLKGFETGFEFDSHLILEQFTNLVDCEDKEIYEGDIVKHGESHLNVLVGIGEFNYHSLWSSGPDMAKIYGIRQRFSGHDKWQEFWQNSDARIVGNIHENPNLI